MAKICIVCGEDCSTRPRVKNAQGQYACAACAKAPRTSPKPQAAPVATVDSEGDLLSETISQAVGHLGQPCPTCGVYLPRDAVLCTHCGLHLERGKQLKTHVSVEKAPKEKKVRGSSGGIGANAGMFHAGAAVIVVAMGAAGFEMWIPAILIVGLMSIIMYFWAMFDAFSSESLTYAWCSIIGIFIPVIGIANLVYGIFLADSRTLRWAYASWTLAYVGLMALLFVHGIEELEKAINA